MSQSIAGETYLCVIREIIAFRNSLQFQYPYGIAVHTHAGKVYVADTDNHRIQVLNEDMTYCSSFGSRGSGNGEFNGPRDLAFSSDGSVLVAD